MATIQLQIQAGLQDAYVLGDLSGYNATTTTLRLDSSTAPGSRHRLGLIFDLAAAGQPLLLPGSTINFALLSMQAAILASNPRADVYYEDVDQAVDYPATDTGDNPASRARSTFLLDQTWILTTGGYNAQAITTVLQDLVDNRPGFTGNRVSLILFGRSDMAITNVFIEAFEGATAIAQLDVDFDPPAAGPPRTKATDAGTDRGTDRGVD